MQGKIIRGIAGFYYVHVEGIGILECKAKGIFRNDKLKPLVGDNVDGIPVHSTGRSEVNVSYKEESTQLTPVKMQLSEQ